MGTAAGDATAAAAAAAPGTEATATGGTWRGGPGEAAAGVAGVAVARLAVPLLLTGGKGTIGLELYSFPSPHFWQVSCEMSRGGPGEAAAGAAAAGVAVARLAFAPLVTGGKGTIGLKLYSFPCRHSLHR